MSYDLKSFFDRARVARLADELARAWPAFPREAFVKDASSGLEDLELMDRARHIAAAMQRALPDAYPDALAIVVRALGAPLPTEGNGMEAFHHHPHAVFVQKYGLDHPDASLAAMREITKRSSCEFAVRPYIERHPERTMAELRAWTKDADEHVRRLVSEGTRPRLPWGSRLREFQKDPAPALALLETLKDDPSEYVRRSVANHLNDVAKDHPDVAIATCAAWLEDATQERRKLVHHALRSLVREGHPDAIRLAGGAEHARVRVSGDVAPTRPRIGESMRATIEVTNEDARETTVVLGLRVHFVKANGEASPKTFKLPTTKLGPRERVVLTKTVSLAQQTTRKHYAGTHVVEVVVNGEARALGRFELRA